MPNIEDINGVAAASVGAFSGVSASNIAKVDGVDLVTFTGLLDTYTGASEAHSTRRLSSSTTTLMRVRRDTNLTAGDDDEADVTYDSNNELSLDSAISNASVGVTATTLGEFLNVGTVGGTTYSNPDSLTVTASCFVDEWTDQSGNGNHATQGTFGSQPQIHSGTVNTDLITDNGKPALQFIVSASDMGMGATSMGDTYVVCNITNSATQILVLTNLSVQPFGPRLGSASPLQLTAYKNGTILSPQDRDELHTQFVQTGQSLYSGIGTYASSSLFMNLYNLGAFNVQEVIIYSASSTNQSGIETNINGHFSIYP